MKIKLCIPILSAAVFFSLTLKSHKISHNSPLPILTPYPTNITNTFLMGAMQDGKAPDYSHIADELGLNLWHQYTVGEFNSVDKKYYPLSTGWSSNDHLFTDPSGYVSDVKAKLRSLTDVNMRSLMQRPKIEWLCYGQRSDYQCEIISDTDDNWFYSFQTHETGHDVMDGTLKVRKCLTSGTSPDLPGYVVKNLKANTEQCHRGDPGSGNEWQVDSFCDWYIKPRVKVDAAFVVNFPDENIFNVRVIDEGGRDTMNVDIKAKYFLPADGGTYLGNYIDEFNFGSSGLDLKIHGDWGSGWAYSARGNGSSNNKADIQIYWYGNCNMSIDYVRVDNDVAQNLLDTISTKNPTHLLYESWLLSEAQNIACFNDSPLKFYIELSEYNNIPCISYVNHRLNFYESNCGKNVNVMTDLTNMYSVHVPWENTSANLDKRSLENAEHIARNYIEKAGMTQIFMESYPFWACHSDIQTFSKIPNTLSKSSGTGILATKVLPVIYDDWLQDNLDHIPNQLEAGALPADLVMCNDNLINQDPGNFRYRMQLGDEISKQADIPFVYMMQTHLWYEGAEVRREPTIEEMDLMSNISVSYGSRGIIFFEYGSNPLNVPGDYSFGLFNTLNEPREENIYGQPKWNKAKDIVKRLKNTWGPYLMSFDNCNRHSYIYRLQNERDALLSGPLFNDVLSYKVSTYPNHITDRETVSERSVIESDLESELTKRDVSFTDSNTGYVCGDSGIIFKTMNAGVNWNKLISGTAHNLRGISFIDANTGIIAGDSGVVLKTTNGGIKWSILNTGSTDLLHAQMINTQKGICAGANGKIIVTSDGGATWINQIIGINVDLNMVYFVNQNIGFICGDSGKIFKTFNGGNSWNSLNSKVKVNLKSIYFADINTGYSVGNAGVILKTTNGGISWQSQISRTKNNLNSVYFNNASVGKAVGDRGIVLNTFDGGITWNTMIKLVTDCIIREDLQYIYSSASDTTYTGCQRTYKLTTGTPTTSESYLQVATFNNPNEQNSKYFMIVNRRCSPFYDSIPEQESGIRYVQIKLDPMSGSHYWDITEIGGSLSVRFDGSSISTIDLDWFRPGEGKLYKIESYNQE